MTDLNEEKLYLPRFCVIPLQARLNNNLTDSAKIYLGELNVLSNKYGYCFASDKNLSEMKDVSISTIERWHALLEKEGFIKRDSSRIHKKNPKTGVLEIQTKRKIFVYENPFENSNNFTDPSKIKGPCDPSKIKGPCDPSKIKGISKEPGKQESKNNNKEEPSAAAVSSIYECLKDIDISKTDKEWISGHYSEKAVSHAICYVQSPTVTIKTTLVQALKWACETQPEIPIANDPESITENNRERVKKALGHLNGKELISKSKVKIKVVVEEYYLDLNIEKNQNYKHFVYSTKNCFVDIKKCFLEIFNNAEKLFKC